MSLRNFAIFSCDSSSVFKEKLLRWIPDSTIFAFFDAQQFNSNPVFPATSYDWIAGIDAVSIVSPVKNSLMHLQEALNNNPDWHFGFIGYDIKNEIEALFSAQEDLLEFPTLFFFQPRVVVFSRNQSITISIYDDEKAGPRTPSDLFDHINSIALSPLPAIPETLFAGRTPWSLYLEKIKRLHAHIRRGDIYEINFCIDFFAENISLDPATLFGLLQKNSPSPFSCFIRAGNNYIISASPERYMKKTGPVVISQPMKGTVSRGLTDSEDQALKKRLQWDEKERAENIMIVDLVRNDLSRIAIKGSVKVDELAGVYPFPKVHQLISTVSCQVNPLTSFTDIISKTFPMGSMTGAPKIRAMQLIEEHENSRRGAFSGAAGFIEPNGDFDFNVIIRSFLYQKDKQYLSVKAGSAITANSDPEKEYKECLLKAGYVIKAIGGKITG